jgi:hypothetical protein
LVARRGRGRRWLGAFVALLLVLAGLFLAIDRLAVGVTEQALADELRSSQDLPSAPDVEVTGFPFLSQAIRGTYRHLELRIDRLDAGEGVRIDVLDVGLDGVHVPLGEALRRSLSQVPVDRADARARISFATLESAVAAQLDPDVIRLGFAAAGGDRLRVTGRYTGPGGPIDLDTTARLSLARGRLRVAVPRTALGSLPPALRPELARRLDLALDPPDLPFGFRPVGVSVDARGVSVRAEGTDLVLNAG